MNSENMLLDTPHASLQLFHNNDLRYALIGHIYEKYAAMLDKATQNSSITISHIPKIKQVASVIAYNNSHMPEIVLVHSTKDNAWGLPGGKINPGEHLNFAVRREFGEETQGMVLSLENYVCDVFVSISKNGNLIINLLCRGYVVSGQHKAIDNFVPNKEIDAITFAGLDEMLRLPNSDMRTRELRTILQQEREYNKKSKKYGGIFVSPLFYQTKLNC